jgi:hypothetical protein
LIHFPLEIHDRLSKNLVLGKALMIKGISKGRYLSIGGGKARKSVAIG